MWETKFLTHAKQQLTFPQKIFGVEIPGWVLVIATTERASNNFGGDKKKTRKEKFPDQVLPFISQKFIFLTEIRFSGRYECYCVPGCDVVCDAV